MRYQIKNLISIIHIEKGLKSKFKDNLNAF